MVTWWHLEAPLERTCQALIAPEEWPRWWRYVEKVVELEKGDAHGIGAVRRYTWSSRLPYRLSLEMRTTAIAQPTFIEGVATGDLNGTGRWQLQELGNTTRVQ